MANGINICRLCLKAIFNNNFEELDSCKIRMLNLISLELNLALIAKPIICLKCSNSLQQIFDFKATCLTNDAYLKTFIHCDRSVKLTLEEIVHKSVARNEVKCEEERVCRFCLRYLDIDYFTKLNAAEEDIFLKDMLQKCLPEIDLNITNAPLMCQDCMELLQNQFNFVVTCLDNDENIKNYAKGTNNNHRIILSDVVKFVESTKKVGRGTNLEFTFVKLEKCGDDVASVDYDVVKKEVADEEEEVDYYVKSEESQKIEGDRVEIEEYGDSRQPSDQSLVTGCQKLYTCSECSHQTNRKDSLELHHLVHRDLPRSELLKCEKCDFVTKWRSSLNIHHLLHQKPQDIVMYQCAHCPYESKYKKHLRRHSKKHMDVDLKKFHCQYCKLKTEDSWYFKQHNKTKHGKVVLTAKDEGYSCKKCSFESKYKTELDTHKKKTHKISKYTCHCGYTTQRLYHFKEHSLKHQGHDEVPMLQCEVCDFRTKYRKSLQNHSLLHQEGRAPKKGAPRKKKSEVSEQSGKG